MPVFSKPNKFSRNFNKKTPFRILPLLAMAGKALLGSAMSHGSKQDQEKIAAAETKAQSTQFQTPETETKYFG